VRINRAAMMAARGLVERKACRRLEQLAATVPKSQAIVELGAYCGRSTGWLVAGSRGARVWSVDPWEQIAPEAVTDDYAANEPNYRNGKYLAARDQWRAHIKACRITDRMVTPLQMTSIEAARQFAVISDDDPVGLLFHDAVHSYEAVSADLAAWLPLLAANVSVALHDLGDPAFGVEAAAESILEPAGFDWAGRERLLWQKDPARRGLLVVHRNSGER